jgi:nanoRNase/pAp phosphatase (c-di-AMP/oligoRNAs hydrolase)
MPELHHSIPLAKEICSAIPEEFVSMAETLKQNLYTAKNVLLTTHIGADGDGLAAMLILKDLIMQINPHAEVQMLLSDRVKNDKYSFLPNYKD